MKYIITESQYRVLTETIEFNEIYKKTYPTMFKSVCMRYAKGDYDLASDYCQLGYVRVHEKLHTFSNTGSIDGWVRRVIITTILNEIKRNERFLGTTSDFDFERNDIADEPVQYFETDEFMGKYSEKDIQDAIKSLPEGYKFVFKQFYFNDKSHKEIAKMLGVEGSTSRTQLLKAKNKVKNYLERLKR
jgi:RNA polymerase sigma-70 factor (ECF subfamily)